MTQDDILKAAKKAGFHVDASFVMPPHQGHLTHELRQFAKIVATAERTRVWKKWQSKEESQP